MKEKKLFLSLIFIIILMVTILFTNIGYASEKIINDNIKNVFLIKDLNVGFNKKSRYRSHTVNIIDSKTVLLNDITLNNVGESQTFFIPIINNSEDMFAKIHFNIFNSNTEYFKVSCNNSELVLSPDFDEAIIEVKVQLIKEPLTHDEFANIKIDIVVEQTY